MDSSSFSLISRQLGEDVLAVEVAGELDLLTVPQLGRFVRDQLTASGARHLLLDLAQVRFLGSTAAGLLVTLDRYDEPVAADLHLTGVRGNRRVERPLELMGLAKIFDIVDDQDELLRRLQP